MSPESEIIFRSVPLALSLLQYSDLIDRAFLNGALRLKGASNLVVHPLKFPSRKTKWPITDTLRSRRLKYQKIDYPTRNSVSAEYGKQMRPIGPQPIFSPSLVCAEKWIPLHTHRRYALGGVELDGNIITFETTPSRTKKHTHRAQCTTDRKVRRGWNRGNLTVGNKNWRWTLNYVAGDWMQLFSANAPHKFLHLEERHGGCNFIFCIGGLRKRGTIHHSLLTLRISSAYLIDYRVKYALGNDLMGVRLQYIERTLSERIKIKTRPQSECDSWKRRRAKLGNRTFINAYQETSLLCTSRAAVNCRNVSPSNLINIKHSA